MNWRNSLQNLSGRLRRFNDSVVSVKIIAIILLSVFIPSLLVTALGLFAVHRAESTLRDRLQDPVLVQLRQLEEKLSNQWDHHLRRYADRLPIEENLNRYILSIPRADTHVRQVFLREGEEFQPLEAESPLRVLDGAADHAELNRAWELEFQRKDLPAARNLYQKIIQDGAPDAVVESLAGLSRVQAALGEWREAIRTLRLLIDRFGKTIGEAQVPRGLPATARIIEIARDNGDPVTVSTYERELAGLIDELAPWIDEDLAKTYRRKISSASLVAPAGDPKEEAGGASPLTEADLESYLREHPASRDTPQTSGYLRFPLKNGQFAVVAFIRTGKDQRTVYLDLNPQSFLEDSRLFTRELQIPDAFLRYTAVPGGIPPPPSSLKGAAAGNTGAGAGPVPALGPGPVAGAAGSPPPLQPAGKAGAEAPPPSEELLTRSFPRPFQHLSMHYYPPPNQGPQHLQYLETLKTTGLTWAIVVLVLTISLGILITVRSVLQEMQVSRIKSDFVSFVTHELKTPLTAIQMFTETLLLGRAGDKDEERKFIELIDKESARLSRLIQQILEFSRIEKRQQVFQFTTCDMAEVAREAVRLFKEHNADRQLEIEINQAQHISKIRMDRSAMIELILNLLSNAYKYTRESRRKIIINLRESIDNISVDVVDFGMGIPKREHRKIFEKFYRAQDYLTREIEGTGLGLTFARYIAKVHNGDIKVTSAVNQGSTFTLELRKNQVLSE